MNRRAFLSLLPSLALAGSTKDRPPARLSKETYLYLPLAVNSVGKYGLLELNITKGQVQLFETAFAVHQVTYDKAREELTAVNKYGPQFFRSRRSSLSSVKLQSIGSDFALSGHSASIESDPHLYFTATELKSQQNCLLALNKDSLEISKVIRLGQSDPPVHDCKFLPNSSILAATSAAFLHMYDTKTQILKSHPQQLSKKQSSLRHFEANQNFDICLQGNVIKTGAEYKYTSAEVGLYRGKSAQFFSMDSLDPQLKDHELLDFAFTQDGQKFACVHGGTSTLSLWSTQPFEHLKLIQFPGPIIRVMEGATPSEFFILGQQSFYRLNWPTGKIEVLSFANGYLKKSYSYGHKTLLDVNV